MKILNNLVVFLLLLNTTFISYSQQDTTINNLIDINYYSPKEYEIGGVIVSGANHLDHPSIINISGLEVGTKIYIPSDKITMAIDKLWKQGIFDDIQILVDKVQGRTIWLNIALKAKPRLSSFRFEGIKASEADKIRETIKLASGDIVTENLKLNTINKIRDYFMDKGYYNVNVLLQETKDTTTTRNDVTLLFKITKGKKTHIKDIVIKGSRSLTTWIPFMDSKDIVLSKMKDTKKYHWWKFWKSSRFSSKNFEDDKKAIIEKYNEEGYRNARIVSDSVYLVKNKKGKQELFIDLNIDEGDKFVFRNITWVGNTKYTSEELSKRLRINKGDPYNKALLEKNIHYDPTGIDISALYQDDGYLFFQIIPVEIKVENDSIDIEMRVYEGKQARIGKVSLAGNTRTNDHVIMRELKTRPGELFSRDNVIRSIRELQQLQYFDQESLTYDIKPDIENGLVNIEYKLKEVTSDKLELSGGWGAGMIIGTVGVTFLNFSTKNFFEKDAWKPLPSGDGQQLSVRAQTNGTYYYSLSASFTEPWLGGRKPNALSTSVYYSYQDDGYWNNSGSPEYWLSIFGASVSLGKRLNWPDDYFTFVQGISFQQYNVKNYTAITDFSNGRSNNINYNLTLARNSSDSPIFPRLGSDVSVAGQFTFPYSLVNGKDYSTISTQERYKWLEYYKVNVRASWYFNLIDDFVVSTRVRFGFLGQYNKKVGYSPFERFYVGGDGLQGWALDGREIVALRGYTTAALSPSNGATVFDKFTLDLRYPITMNPMMSIYVLTFFEAGNSWANFEGFSPFKMYRSFGVGLRLFMPMFGLIGIDWGYGIDQVPGSPSSGGSQFHFSIGQSID
ncbi:MAG: outer membrane protein assembly factor BamA [Bacteroidales bacterium]|jgi:outer membrane protein insertion porin family|nr:outer membrane protein assembly factor BamA [Bacteroidales bacterium]